jgi:hypothetical protein
VTRTGAGPTPRRHPRLSRAAAVVGWLVVAALAATVTYALLVFGGR